MIDPVKVLQPETLSHLFCLLSTPRIASSSQVSRERRRHLLSDTSLHRVIDLTSCHPGQSELELVKLIHRLPFVSTFTQEIKLDLQSHLKNLDLAFSKNDPQIGLRHGPSFEQLIGATDYRYISLLTSLALATGGKLQRLFIQIPNVNDLYIHMSRGKQTGSFSSYCGHALIEGGFKLDGLLEN